MKPRIVERGPFHVVGVRERFEMGKLEGMGALWDRFIQGESAIPDKVGRVHYGIAEDDDTPESRAFRYTACVEVRAPGRVPAGMTGLTLPGGRYAVFTYRGPISKFAVWVREVWSRWLPAAGLTPTAAPNLEVYDERFKLESLVSEVDYWVPVARPL